MAGSAQQAQRLRQGEWLNPRAVLRQCRPQQHRRHRPRGSHAARGAHARDPRRADCLTPRSHSNLPIAGLPATPRHGGPHGSTLAQQHSRNVRSRHRLPGVPGRRRALPRDWHGLRDLRPRRSLPARAVNRGARTASERLEAAGHRALSRPDASRGLSPAPGHFQRRLTRPPGVPCPGAPELLTFMAGARAPIARTGQQPASRPA
jgi:hypothetical protein